MRRKPATLFVLAIVLLNTLTIGTRLCAQNASTTPFDVVITKGHVIDGTDRPGTLGISEFATEKLRLSEI